MVEADRGRLAGAGLRGAAAGPCNGRQSLFFIGARKVGVSLSKDITDHSLPVVRTQARPGYYPLGKAFSTTVDEAMEWASGRIYAFVDGQSVKNSASIIAQDIEFGTKSTDLWLTGHGLLWST